MKQYSMPAINYDEFNNSYMFGWCKNIISDALKQSYTVNNMAHNNNSWLIPFLFNNNYKNIYRINIMYMSEDNK